MNSIYIYILLYNYQIKQHINWANNSVRLKLIPIESFIIRSRSTYIVVITIRINYINGSNYLIRILNYNFLMNFNN